MAPMPPILGQLENWEGLRDLFRTLPQEAPRLLGKVSERLGGKSPSGVIVSKIVRCGNAERKDF